MVVNLKWDEGKRKKIQNIVADLMPNLKHFNIFVFEQYKTFIMKIFTSSLLLLCGFIVTSLAQAPASFSYQGVLRDNSGNILANHTAAFRFSLRSFNPLGLIVYRETNNLTTNAFGLFSTAIGTGTVVAGDINTINWTAGSMFLQVEVDVANGSNYTDMGTSQLLSVPYAMHSTTSENIELPFHDTIYDAQDAFYVYNDGNGGGLVGVVGTGDQMGNYVAAVKGIALPSFSNTAGIGVSGQINSYNGIGVKGYNQSGWGMWGETDYGTAIRAEANSGKALWAESTDGDAGYFYSENGYALTTEGGWTGIGTTQPAAPLHVWSDGNLWDLDLSGSYGDFYVGQNGYGLRVGVAIGGGGAGDVRIRAFHGTGRLILGGFQRDAITIEDQPIGVRIGNNYPINSSEALRVENTGILGGIAVRGVANNSGAGYGIGGYFEGYTTGVYGEATTPNTGYGVYGLSNQPNGAAVYAYSGGNGAAALDIANGPLKVSGSNPVAFVVNNANSSCINYQIPGDGIVLLIDNPYCNNDPNAMLFITNRNNWWSIVDAVVGVSYSSYYNKWYIHDTEIGEDIGCGSEFNVLVIKQ